MPGVTVLILVRPQMGENIGAAARVMGNFGLPELRLVAPRDGWPNPAAEAMAAHAGGIVAAAQVFDTTWEAIADLQYVVATTARERAMEKTVLDPREAAGTIVQQIQAGRKTGILFGPERTGLENEEVALAHAILAIRTAPGHASLNLAQAVAVAAYELSLLGPQPAAQEQETPASHEEMQALFDHLEAELDARNFWKVAEKKPRMWNNLRNLLLRTQMSEQEIRTFRGLIKSLTDY